MHSLLLPNTLVELEDSAIATDPLRAPRVLMATEVGLIAWELTLYLSNDACCGIAWSIMSHTYVQELVYTTRQATQYSPINGRSRELRPTQIWNLPSGITQFCSRVLQ